MNRRHLKTVAVHFVFLACSILVSNTDFAWWLFPICLTVYLVTLGMFIEQIWQEAMKH
jgi:hypothetical protein